MRLNIVATTLLLGGCAAAALSTAERQITQHEEANTYVNVDLLDVSNTTEAQRAPEIRRRKEEAQACHDQFQRGFVSLVNSAQASGGMPVDAVAAAAGQLDSQYGECIRPYGLIGHPEFKVGDAYMRPAQFVRSWAAAIDGLRQARAHADADGMAWAAAVGTAARRAAEAPPPQVTRSVYCTSHTTGGITSTSCN